MVYKKTILYIVWKNFKGLSSKVRIFWEGQKDLAHFPIFFWHYILLSNYKWKMCQIFVAFSEYLNFKKLLLPTLDFRWSFPLFLSASIIKLSQSYSLHRFSKKNPFFYRPYWTWWILLHTWELIEADHEVLKYFDVFQFAAWSQFVT